MRVNQVLGFLGVGVVVGPFGAGSIVNDWPMLSWVSIPRHQGVQALAELGVIFLMFLIGLVLSLSYTAVVMQLLSQDRTLATPMGKACFPG
jgi:CPA2 family monovalent cation:H+ antiporter-2